MNTYHLARFTFFYLALIVLSSANAETGASGDVFTPVIASTVSPETYAIHGSDGAYHVVHELQLTNTKSLPATIRSIDVLERANGSRVIISFSRADRPDSGPLTRTEHDYH
jgi:hypothetical protein